MKTFKILGPILIVSLLALPAFAGGSGNVQNYFRAAAAKVMATADPVEKRDILDNSFHAMFTALELAQGVPFISEHDSLGIAHLKATIQERRDELAGRNGYERVSDQQLNSFANYVVQDLEQADEVITISLVTLVIIVLLVLLVV
jgi:hypothetical protein